MNALLLFPEFPSTFWSFKHALKFVGKRAALPPLGLLTVSAMLPRSWSQRVVDTNVKRLRDADLEWADVVLISAMAIQRQSARRLIDRCRESCVKVIAGGPLFTVEPEGFSDVDHLILGEAEVTLPRFLFDLESGNADAVYRSDARASLSESPTPRWDLADLGRYATLSVQYSRGCPFDCEFCNVTSLLGRRLRTKSVAQVLEELDTIYGLGWRDGIFFVDDNFIGGRKRLKEELLPALINWRADKPRITFLTEASIDLADDPGLMRMMVAAGFDTVFIGIETPDERSLDECGKKHNLNRDLVGDIRRLHKAGLQVQGGFIIGFDHDTPTIFERQIELIQRSGVVTAMVGILQALPGTRLFGRMKDEGRLVGESTGDNVDGTTNILTRMDGEVLSRRYQWLLDYIYAPRQYYRRVRTFLRDLPRRGEPSRANLRELMAFARSSVRLGIFGRERFHYWGLVFWTVFRCRRHLPLAVTLAIYGHHFRKVARHHVGA